MIKITDKSLCSGCHACMSVCPKSAIAMEEDSEGFVYPIIDERKCISCGLCDKSCQAINPIFKERQPNAYACNNLNDEIRMQSSSGGIFSLIAEWIISQNGIVFGAGFDDKLNVVHIAVDNVEDLSKLRGSKYVQSIIGDAFIQAKLFLEDGRKVLFTGTPCQIDGLLHYLKKDYDGLYTQDIVCHGVPSAKVWQKYLRYQEQLNGALVLTDPSPSFRSKDKGWTSFNQTLYFDNGKTYSKIHRQDVYMKAFLKNVSLRHSCYDCHSKSVNRNSDITLADLWGCKSITPDMFDDKGTSFVIVNSEKGEKLFDAVVDRLSFQVINIEDAIKCNSPVCKSPYKPKNRQFFFENIDNMDFAILVEKVTKLSFFKKVQTTIKNYGWAIKNKLKNIF